MYKHRLQLAIVAQVIAASVTAAIIFYDLSLKMSEDQITNFGGTLTISLILLGVFAHVTSNKAPVPPGVLVLLSVFAPAFAYLGGPLQQVMGYHFVTLCFYGIVLHNQFRLEQKMMAEDVPTSEDGDA